MRVKICGLRRSEDIHYANLLKPDFIGFVFAEGKRRTITIKEAKLFREMLDKDITAVGVFRNNDITLVEEAVREKVLDMIQLHGDEDDEYIKKIRSFTDLPIIKAYRKSPYADYMLYDNADPGMGKTFDWKEIDGKKPFFLAGGITVDNLDAAMALKPYCIDVSSSVETDGFKDFEKMKEFIKRCKEYE